MRFIKIEQKEAAGVLAETLQSALKQSVPVTWFLSGGSNIDITIAAMEQLPEELTKNLILAQVDERYGSVGHPDSNWKQLLDAGLNIKQARAMPILHDPELPLIDTAAITAKMTGELIKRTYTIGQFGVGSDYHIAGIKPDSPACIARDLAVGYEWTDFKRITITFDAIRQMNRVLTFMFGETKKPVLDSLMNEHHQPLAQPVQILKSIDSSVVYNDQLGEELTV